VPSVRVVRATLVFSISVKPPRPGRLGLRESVMTLPSVEIAALVSA
jgi:hypothetical protein